MTHSYSHPSEIDFPGLEEFIEFFHDHGVRFFFIEAMQRRHDKSHSGGICQTVNYKKGKEEIYPFKGPFGSRKLHFTLRCLQSFLNRHKRFHYDLYIKSSARGYKYHRTILIDDLNEPQIKLLMDYWTGSIALIETSVNNYQAILIVADELGLKASERTSIGRHLAIKFDGDKKATAANQLHRFPGSPNHKRTVTEGELPFVTRLVQLRRAKTIEAGADVLSVLKAQPRVTFPKKSKPAREVSHLVEGGRDETNSGKAFRWAMAKIKAGKSDGEIGVGLQSIFGVGHTDDPHWIPRTIFNARAILARSPDRYWA